MGRNLLHRVDPSRSEDSLRRFQVRKTLLHATVGLGFGLLVLHPVSMAVFGWLGVHPGGGSVSLGISLLWRSFTIDMFPMGVVFGLFGMVIGAMDGYHRSVLQFQRNRLARQLALNEELRRELEGHNQRLRELEMAKRRSTYFLVHDLKTHLGCVLGFAELLLKRATKERRHRDREALERIVRQGRQMLSAVIDLLDLARLEEVPGLDLDWADVPSMLLEALENVDAPGVDGRVQIGHRHAHCPVVWSDRRLVVRVLANLITNALKHNPDGVNVIIDAAPADGDVVFSCHDDGPGIPAEPVPRLFDEFVTESEQTLGHASGLGLAFCRAAVEAHGGRIWCESGLGRGTTFQFTLPVRSEIT